MFKRKNLINSNRSNLSLTETEEWTFKITRDQLLGQLKKVTGQNAWNSGNRKDKVDLFLGVIGENHFEIKENPNIGRLGVSGTINSTKLMGRIQDTSEGSIMSIDGKKEDFEMMIPLMVPFILGAIGLMGLYYNLLYILAILILVVIFEMLIIRGFNSEIREGMAKFKLKLEEIEHKIQSGQESEMN